MYVIPIQNLMTCYNDALKKEQIKLNKEAAKKILGEEKKKWYSLW
ncbi:unnamed protein product [marine sediment metagenome]|uniref:Uncharacterized protein n=1 Tax=marine sediment metagenome TaxID=412755 RepID=X1L8K9_9ZZZZ